jgi:nucleoside diphosphate kinase
VAASLRSDAGAASVTVALANDVIPPESLRPLLTRSSIKQQLYSVDTYFRDSWEDVVRVCGPRAVDVARRHALLLLKPDAVVRRKLVPALKWLESEGWDVAYAQCFRVNRWAVRAFWQYQWNTATRERREMADLFMSATDSLVLLLRFAGEPAANPAASTDPGEWACSILTGAKGGSAPHLCRPGQLRYVLDTLNQQLNLVHSADEPADLIREVGICFTTEERGALYSALAAGTNARDDAFRLAQEMESAQEPLDLSLTGTVDQLLRRTGDAPDFSRRLTRLRSGEAVSWPELESAADRSGVELAEWERVVLGTYLLVPTFAGVVPLLPDASTLFRAEDDT